MRMGQTGAATDQQSESEQGMSQEQEFNQGDMVVYPAHGVGTVEGIETTVIGGENLTLYTITFKQERMRLKLPVQKPKIPVCVASAPKSA